MTAKRYVVAGREFSKVADVHQDRVVHIVERGQFWKGDRSWLHRAVCGKSVGGVPVSRPSVDCKECRAKIVQLRNGSGEKE